MAWHRQTGEMAWRRSVSMAAKIASWRRKRETKREKRQWHRSGSGAGVSGKISKKRKTAAKMAARHGVSAKMAKEAS